MPTAMFELAPSPHTLEAGLRLFFALIIGHALADYPLQGNFLALHKNRHYRDASRELPPCLWVHCLLAHSLIHAGFVWVLTGRVFFAVAELLAHAFLDFIKCEKHTNFNLDQLLHMTCKALYVVALVQGWVA